MILSLSRPWDWAVFDDIARKHIDNRPWAPRSEATIGQVIALQSADSWDPYAIGHFRTLNITHHPARYDQYPRGIIRGIIRGVVTLERVVHKAGEPQPNRAWIADPSILPPDQQRWFFGRFGLVFTNVRRLGSPVRCGGVQGLRQLSPEVERAVTEALPP